jgi:ATP-dependent exoDNAse (exonuclease V) alpha subunit
VAVPLDAIRKNFVHDHCRTCHSFQGSSIDNEITILDWKFVHVNRKWIYTAITRARDLNKVYFHDYHEKPESEQDMMSYFQSKVERYKQQDRKGKKIIDESRYITKEWLANCVGKSCNSCGDCLIYTRETGKIECNITAQRLNSKTDGHHLDNIVPYCIHCNCAMSNRE